jgi:hypothetical protein
MDVRAAPRLAGIRHLKLPVIDLPAPASGIRPG